MNRNMTKLGSLAVTAMFSYAAIAQTVTKPRPRAEEAIRPGASAVQTAPTAKTSGLKNLLEQRTPVTAPAARPAGQNCSSVEQLASKLSADTRVSYADALAALQFWGGRITIGSCNAEAGGLLSYNAQARGNFLEAAVEGMKILNGRKDFSAEKAQQVWAEALASAKNNDGKEKTSAAAELATVKALQDNCGILKLTN